MSEAFEPEKHRDIVFNAEPPGRETAPMSSCQGCPTAKLNMAMHRILYASVITCTTTRSMAWKRLLTEEGFNLDHSPLHNIGRQVIYYCEDTACHNLDIPFQPTKKTQREVFVKAYDHEPHGDHDDTPPELREYK